MPIPFHCPSCRAFTEVADEHAGQSGACKKCGDTITVPASGNQPLKVPRCSFFAGWTWGTVITCLIAACLIGLIALLVLPAFQSTHHQGPRQSCSNNLKQIALAMHNYNDVYKSLPPAYTVDEEGNRLHSWRTLLLPFLEQVPLYEQIDLTKPWDAPENRLLLEVQLSAFQCPAHPNDGSPRTDYMLIVGPGALFDGDQTVSFRDILDGSSNTIMIVEVTDQSVHWAEPQDLSFDERQITINAASADPGSYHQGCSLVALADGSVRILVEKTSPEVMKALITRAGGEAVEVP
jgi:hypothetical protein